MHIFTWKKKPSGYTKGLLLKAFFANIMLFLTTTLSRLFITLGYTCVLLFDVFNGCSNSIKEITMNRLINKGVCVLLLDVFKHSLVQLKK